jgi:hypothetical protein
MMGRDMHEAVGDHSMDCSPNPRDAKNDSSYTCHFELRKWPGCILQSLLAHSNLGTTT